MLKLGSCLAVLLACMMPVSAESQYGPVLEEWDSLFVCDESSQVEEFLQFVGEEMAPDKAQAIVNGNAGSIACAGYEGVELLRGETAVVVAYQRERVDIVKIYVFRMMVFGIVVEPPTPLELYTFFPSTSI